MNKKLVAVAVAGLLAAPLAAQAQTANVTLYGRLNMTMEAVNGQSVDTNLPAVCPPNNQNCNVVNRTLYRVNSNSSRIGVRGSESLGGGLSAIFQIEDAVTADISGGVHGSRETFVGLQGTWGTFKMGRFLAPYDDIHSIFGNVPTLTTSILSTANLWAQGSLSPVTDGGFDDREANSIRYDSPRLGGFTFSQQISAFDFAPATGSGSTATWGDLAQAKRHAYMGSFGGFYANGPFQAGVAYEWHQKVRGPSLNDYALSVAANWNFGIVKIGGVWERLDYDVLNNSDLSRNFYAISATVPFGPGEFYALYGTARNGSGPCISTPQGTACAKVGQLVAGPDTGADQWTISYTYALSKRTLAYAGFQQVRNDDNAAYNFNINSYTVVNGANANGFVLGLVHFF